jgi:hypothetical protein
MCSFMNLTRNLHIGLFLEDHRFRFHASVEFSRHIISTIVQSVAQRAGLLGSIPEKERNVSQFPMDTGSSFPGDEAEGE